jgi:hypothetical protein
VLVQVRSSYGTRKQRACVANAWRSLVELDHVLRPGPQFFDRAPAAAKFLEFQPHGDSMHLVVSGELACRDVVELGVLSRFLEACEAQEPGYGHAVDVDEMIGSEIRPGAGRSASLAIRP